VWEKRRGITLVPRKFIQQKRLAVVKMKPKTYKWVVLLLGTLCLLASLGLGRFSFGAILPFMKEGLSLNYGQTGIVASGIFLGYLISAFFSGHFVIRYSAKKVIIFSCFLIIVGMTMAAFSPSFGLAYVASFIIGIGSGGANVPALGLVSKWFTPAKRGMALGVVNSGSGLGMVFSGLVVPVLIGLHPQDGWRFSWGLLALLVVVIVVLNLLFLKNSPDEVGMEPFGKTEKQNRKRKRFSTEGKSEVIYKNKTLWGLGFIYLTWGFSYLIFSTFMVDYLISDVQMDKVKAGQMFAIGGFVSIFSGFLMGSMSDKIGRYRTLLFIYTLQGSMLVAMGNTDHDFLILIEVILYALTLWGVPTVANAAISDLIHPRVATMGMGFITLFFGIGQFISPVVSGFLLESGFGYISVFLLSAVMAFIGGIGCLLLDIKNKKDERVSIQAS
jgi:MFS family permease